MGTEGCAAWTWIGPINYSPWEKNACILRHAVEDGKESFATKYRASSYQRSDNMVNPVGPIEPSCVWKDGYPVIGEWPSNLEEIDEQEDEVWNVMAVTKYGVEYLNNMNSNMMMAVGLLFVVVLAYGYKVC